MQKNNEIPSVCIVLISSLANINIIYAIDCSKLFFFVVWKKKLHCSIVWCIGYLKLNQLSKVFFNWKQMQLIWRGGDVCNLLSFTTSLTNQFPAKSPTLVLFLHKKGCPSFEYLCAITLNICCLENALSN